MEETGFQRIIGKGVARAQRRRLQWPELTSGEEGRGERCLKNWAARGEWDPQNRPACVARGHGTH